MKRARFSQASASSSHGPRPRGDVPLRIVNPLCGVVDVESDEAPDKLAPDVDGLRAFLVDIWKHKKLTDKDICSLCHYVTISGVHI
jgi:hypothetical protein